MLARILVVLLLVSAGSVHAQTTLGGALPQPLPLFPPTNWWNLDISAAPLDPNSAAFITFIGPSTELHPDFGGEEFPGSEAIASGLIRARMSPRPSASCRARR